MHMSVISDVSGRFSQTFFLFGVKKRRRFKMGFEELGLLHVPPETVDEFLILERMLLRFHVSKGCIYPCLER